MDDGELITDHPFVPGDPEYGWERECNFYVDIRYPSPIKAGVEACCGAAPEQHAERIPRGVWLAGVEAERQRDLLDV